MVQPWYVTREEVMAAVDVPEAARSIAQVDRAIGTASRLIEQPDLTNRVFYPEVATVAFDWPTGPVLPWRLWIDRRAQLIQLHAATSGGATVDLADVVLPTSGPPYACVELDADGGYWSAGAGTQRAITLTGLWGYRLDEHVVGQLTAPAAGTLTGGLFVDVTAAAGVGVGSLLRVDEERMQVIGRRMIATGQTLTATLDDDRGATLVQLADASGFAPGETVLVDGERLAVDDVTDTALIVRRADGGSTLTGHPAGTAVYAPRRLAVNRAQLGTTIAGHAAGTPVAVHLVPDPVRDLALAEALVQLGREQSGMVRTIGSGESVRGAPGGDIRDVRDRVRSRYRRSRRTAAI